MRPTLVQVGSGGPFVVRSNPVTAVLDNIRGFCFPVETLADDETGVTEDIEYGEYGSPGSATYTPMDGGPAQTAPAPYSQCGGGTMWDGVQCVPVAADGKPDTCGRDALLAARQALQRAVRDRDKMGVEQVLITSRTCRDTSGPRYKRAWNGLAVEARNALAAIGSAKKKPQVPTAKPVSRAPVPRTPDPTTMTEGNLQGAPTEEPMEGMLDPSKFRKKGFGRR